MNIPVDLHTNEAYWQEYDCPSCGQDFDVSPTPMPGTPVRCGCGAERPPRAHEPNTSTLDADCNMICVTLTVPSVSSR